ncbi:MAG: hypothetical protein MK212_15040 [Saprospiraceae bacterium]|nr:hypothetical protein [Saprospiraceae bacterium]
MIYSIRKFFLAVIICFFASTCFVNAQTVDELKQKMQGTWKFDKVTYKLGMCSEDKVTDMIKKANGESYTVTFGEDGQGSSSLINKEGELKKQKMLWKVKKRFLKDLDEKDIEALKKFKFFKEIEKQGYFIHLKCTDKESGFEDNMSVLRLTKRKMVIMDVGCPIALKK